MAYYMFVFSQNIEVVISWGEQWENDTKSILICDYRRNQSLNLEKEGFLNQNCVVYLGQ